VNSNKSLEEKISLKKKGEKLFSKFFYFFKKNKKKDKDFEKLDKTHKDLDYKLVRSLSLKKIPSVKQLKYSKKVLKPREKIVINISLLLLLVFLIFFAFKIYKDNLKVYPAYGGEYTEGLIGSPRNINPLYSSVRDVDADISRLVFSSLFKRDKDGCIVNDLVKDYSISEDGLEYEFEIKENVKWHHGESLSADDVVFTFDAIKSSEYGSPLRSSFYGVDIILIDSFSFKFVLDEPYPSFLELLTFGILPKNLWFNVPLQNVFLHELNVKPIGSGPYKFKSLAKNRMGDIKEITLLSNEDYYEKPPYIDEITFKFYNNYYELIEALNSGDVDGISYLPYTLKSELISQSSLNFNKLSLPQITSIFLNSKNNSILKERDFRYALAQLIDKEKISEEIFSGNARVAHGPILPSSPSYNDEIDYYSYNFSEAINYLEKNDWKELKLSESEIFLAKDIINLRKEKEEFEEESLEEDFEDEKSLEELEENLNNKLKETENINDWDIKKNLVQEFSEWNVEKMEGLWRFKKVDDEYIFLSIELSTVDLVDNITSVEFIKESWEKAGIKTSIKIISPSQLQSEIIENKDFESLLLSQVVGGDQDVYAFWHSSQTAEEGLNISNYINREVDTLLEEARLSLKEEERIEKYKKFQEILNDDFPVIFLYFPRYNYIQNKKVKGFDFFNILNPADRFNNVANWYLKVNRKIEFQS
jgi:ABC-type transport system substrate-binding protein